MRSIVNFLFTFPYFIYIFSTLNNSCPTINTMLTSKPRYVKSGDSKIWLGNPPLPRRERSVFERTDYIADCRPRRVRSVFERTDNIADYRPRRVRSAFERTDYIADYRPRRVRSVFERTNNFAECRLVVRLTKDRTLGTGFSHGTHRTMSTPSLRDAPSSKGDDEIGGWDY